MTISITWATGVIYVSKVDMTLIQSVPTVIYELNIDDFRLTLKALEDDAAGIGFQKTHDHNTTVDVGGVTLARVVNILAPYTITFEDDQYAVNLVGANSNIGDRVNVNQVSVRSANSAGMTSSAAIEYSSFNGGVTIDVINGVAGTTFPTGTEQEPVSNLDDAKLIASVRGFDKLYIQGNITILATDDIDEYTIFGQNARKTTVTLTSGASTEGSAFVDCTVTGVLDGDTWISHCLVDELAYIQGQIENSVLLDVITLAGTENVRLLNCSDGVPGINSLPVIDMGGTGRDLIITDYDGTIVIRNQTGTDIVEISLARGHIHLEDTVTDGNFIMHGIGTIEDESTGTTIIDDGLINRQLITEATWDTIYLNVDNGVSGTDFPLGTVAAPVDNIIDAMSIAEAHGIETIHIHGDITLGAVDYSGYKITGHSQDNSSVVITSATLVGTIFSDITITGASNGDNFDAINCGMPSGITDICGNLENSILAGTFTIMADCTINMDRCSSMSTTGIVVNLNGTGSFGCANWNGVVTVLNATDAGCLVALTGNYICTLHSTCTAGTAMIAGIGIMNDLSTMTTVIEKTLPGAVWEETMADHLTEGTTGKKLFDGGTGDTAAIAAAVWDELLVTHDIEGSAGAYLTEFYNALASGEVYVSSSTAVEITMIRDKLGDAGVQATETITDEEAMSESVGVVFPAERMIYSVSAVYLATDTTHAGTEYYGTGSFDQYTGAITLETSLPAANTPVLISYTMMRGTPDNVMDWFLDEAKLYVSDYTKEEFTWSDGLLSPPVIRTRVALLAAISYAAMQVLESIAAGDIIQLGYEFRFGDLEVNNQVTGGFHVQAHIDLLKSDIERKLAILGRKMTFVMRSTKAQGRSAWGYKRSPGGRRQVY